MRRTRGRRCGTSARKACRTGGRSKAWGPSPSAAGTSSGRNGLTERRWTSSSGRRFDYAIRAAEAARHLAGGAETAAEALKLTDEAAAVYRTLGLEKSVRFTNVLETRASAQRASGAFPEAEASLTAAIATYRQL